MSNNNVSNDTLSLMQATSHIWINEKYQIIESAFCEEFLKYYPMVHTGKDFFTPDGRLTDMDDLARIIYKILAPYVSVGIAKKVDAIIRSLTLAAHVKDFLPEEDRVHVQNGTLLLDGTFIEGKNQPVRIRLPIRYNPNAPKPQLWINVMNTLFNKEDILVFQEYCGAMLIPSNHAQVMMIIKGNGGEGKSVIGIVLRRMFGEFAKDGDIAKVAENRFAAADLENILLMVDDDMRLEPLRSTNTIKSIVTAKGKMDLERKCVQSHQGYVFVKLLGFTNGAFEAINDQTDGFYRRQLLLQVKPKPEDRIDDPFLSDKLCEELEGIFVWAFEGLMRLAQNNYQFSDSERIRRNQELAKGEANTIDLFMRSTGYIRFDPELSVSCADLYSAYSSFCTENLYDAIPKKPFSSYLISGQGKYNLKYYKHEIGRNGKEVRGFKGVGLAAAFSISGMNSRDLD